HHHHISRHAVIVCALVFKAYFLSGIRPCRRGGVLRPLRRVRPSRGLCKLCLPKKLVSLVSGPAYFAPSRRPDAHSKRSRIATICFPGAIPRALAKATSGALHCHGVVSRGRGGLLRRSIFSGGPVLRKTVSQNRFAFSGWPGNNS